LFPGLSNVRATPVAGKTPIGHRIEQKVTLPRNVSQRRVPSSVQISIQIP
jgi:hypothetical protein